MIAVRQSARSLEMNKNNVLPGSTACSRLKRVTIARQSATDNRSTMVLMQMTEQLFTEEALGTFFKGQSLV